jgi:hypothetical protein
LIGKVGRRKAKQTKGEVIKMLEADLDEKIKSEASEVSDPDQSPDAYDDEAIGGYSKIDKETELKNLSIFVDALSGCLLLDLGFHCDPSGY